MAPGSTLHVSGFPRGVGTRDLAPDFENVGRVLRIDMPPARSAYARPYAFVEYETPEEAQEAINRLDQRPFSLDPQFSLIVQLARSDSRPSRYGSDRGHVRGPPPRRDRFSDNQYGPEAYDSGYNREYPSRRMHTDNMARPRGAYGPRSYRSQQEPDYTARRRDLSPARVYTEDGPAPYHDVLHNNAASFQKKLPTTGTPVTESSELSQTQKTTQNQDHDQYNPEDVDSGTVGIKESNNKQEDLHNSTDTAEAPTQSSSDQTSQNQPEAVAESSSAAPQVATQAKDSPTEELPTSASDSTTQPQQDS